LPHLPRPPTRRHALATGAAALSALALSTPALAKDRGADSAATLFVEAGGRKLAYRSVGKGKPIVLAHRFRGVLDLWDPALIDALAAQGPATLEQYTPMFFELKDTANRAASQRSFGRLFARESGRSPEVPVEWALTQVPHSPPNPMFPSDEVLQALKNTRVPILHLGGDHDLSVPVENWYALSVK
jgi:pimeloyl-ACP methyl ester carboxylesterase